MEIYIRIHSDDGIVGWWTFDFDKSGRENFICEGKELWCCDGVYDDYCRGTACTSVRQAKREARYAVDLCAHDGDPNPKATFWRMWRGDLVQVKFTRDNRIKIVRQKKGK